MNNSVLIRTTTLLLTCFILIASMSTAALAADGTLVTFKCDFSDATVGTQHGSSNKMGWYSLNSNALGVVDSDAANGIYLDMSGAGMRNFNVASDTITTGKVFVGFSYKYDVPENMSGANGALIYAQSKKNLSSVKILSSQYSDIAGGPTKLEQHDKENFYIGSIGSTISLNNTTSSSNKAETVNVSVNDGSWHEVGYVFDLDKSTLMLIVDGVCTGEYDFPSAYEGTLGTIGFQTSETKYYGSFDNFVVKHIATGNFLSYEAALDEINKTIDVKMDEAISPKTLRALAAQDAVCLKLCGTLDYLPIESVEYVNSAIRFTYTGELETGREYFLDFPQTLTTIFGTALPDAVFVSASPEAAQVIDEGQVVIETHDFESDETLNSAWYNTGGTHEVAVIPDDYKKDNSSTKAMRAKGWALKFGDETSIAKENLKGIMTIEFDYYHTNRDGLLLIFSQAASGGYRNAFPACSDSWKHAKIEIDYGMNQIRSWIDDGSVRTDDASNRTLFPESLAEANYQRLYIAGSNLTNSNFYIDNFRQEYSYSYVITNPYVKSVRYVDVDDNKIGIEMVTPGIKAIEIVFSEDIDPDTLTNISLSPDDVTSFSYDSHTFTCTLLCDLLLAEETGYELIIPDTVTTPAPDCTSVRAATYNFATIQGTFEARNVALLSGGTEISPDDIPTISGASVTVSADIINTNNTSGDITLKYAIYDDDAMVDVGYKTFPIPVGKATLETPVFTVRNNIIPDSIRVFVWIGTLDDPSPAFAPLEYK